ncbi:MAG: hypothetical protein IJJ33_14280 [Victivallales bacterium]|nr:hypothetical protein [Victivallales bacterium]
MKIPNTNHCFPLFAAATLLLFTLSGCLTTMTPEEYENWRQLVTRQNQQWSQELAGRSNAPSSANPNDLLAARKEEIQFLKRKSALLDAENRLLTQRWRTECVESRTAFSSLLSQLNENQDLFYDVRYGQSVQKLSHNWLVPEGIYTAFVDVEHPIQEECQIQAAELFTSKGATPTASNQVQVLLFSKNQKGNYVVHSASPVFAINRAGLNTYRFPHAPLRARQGDYYGFLLGPGVSVDYDELGLGRFKMRDLDYYMGNPKDIHISAQTDARTQDAGVSFAFRIMGMSFPKRLLLFNMTEVSQADGDITRLTVQGRPLNDANIQRGVRLAVFRPSNAPGVYRLAVLSDLMVLPRNGIEEQTVKKDGQTGMAVRRGDVCALLFAPGVMARHLSFPNAKFKVLEPQFDAEGGQCVIQLPLNYSRSNQNAPSVRYDIDFSLH